MNPMQLIQSLKGGGNPQQMLMNIMQQQSGNNPIMQNALEMMNKGDMQGVEDLARNLCKEKGINPDEAVTQLKQQFGMK